MKIFVYWLILTSSFLFAQQDYSFTQYANELKDFVNAPGNWNGSDYAILGGASLTTFGLIYVDEDIRKFAQENHTPFMDATMDVFRNFGEPYVIAGAGLFFLIHGNNTNNSINKRIGFEIFQAYAINIVTTGIVKVSFGRSRPYRNFGAHEFNPLSFENAQRSFFSGHTSSAFMFATILAKNTKGDLAKALLYTTAAITGVSRVYQDRHWFSDVFMGAVAGYVIAEFTHKLHDNGSEKHLDTMPEPLLNITIPF